MPNGAFHASPDSAPILVLDGDQGSALAIVRSLGRSGLSVHVGASDDQAIAFHSRYATAVFRYPDPLVDPSGFQTALL